MGVRDDHNGCIPGLQLKWSLSEKEGRGKGDKMDQFYPYLDGGEDTPSPPGHDSGIRYVKGRQTSKGHPWPIPKNDSISTSTRQKEIP